ncbi:hypothetical protein ABMA27_011023 [Loxostege sticticalis]|uniref:BPTI/Kunitz inhibitor domain-containing protein n=1 Tax=Loxostege sticticalis TaxID=481309 RepID=A0ABR3H323_LOXSC
MKVLLYLCVVICTVYSDPRCLEAVRPGYCKGYAVRYAFYTNDYTCRQFVYSGCDGNNNHFKTLDECQKYCLPELVLSKEV